MVETQRYLRAFGLQSLLDKYGIAATRGLNYPNLVLLKYSHLSPMGERISQECRGLIVDQDDDWKVVCEPFHKFFNYGEPYAATIDWDTATVQEKLDGSLMSLYWYDGKWQVSSSGVPDASGPMGNWGGSMADCFWEMWALRDYELPVTALSYVTFMFEFMTPWNRVVVRHDAPRIVCIGARNLLRGEFSMGGLMGWEMPESYTLATLEDAVKAAESLNPLETEGYVVRDKDFNRVKIKSPRYVALHHMRDKATPRALAQAVQSGESAEILTYFPEMQPEFDRILPPYRDLVSRTQSRFDELSRTEMTQKEFAEAVQGEPCRAALFALRSGKAKTAQEFLSAMPVDALLRLLALPTVTESRT